MNKTIIININGIVFHIEEDAYEVLRTYMTEVKRHFAYSTDSEEIVTDIENRLAEMFGERLNEDHKQVIVLSDVVYVTEKMGNVSDFNIDEEDQPLSVSDKSGKSERKLFRDTDDRIISGVCAGIGHYFGIEPRWIRLIAIIALFTGVGIPLYLVLWLVIPKAVTRADKMAMKGEPINIQNFKKNFDEEIEGLKHGLNRAHKEAKPVINQLLNFIGNVIKLFIKFIGILIIFAGVIGLFALIIGLFTFLGYWNSSQLNTFPFNIVNPGYKSVITLSAFVLIFIPLAALVLFAIRVVSVRFAVSTSIYFGMLIIWLGALGIGVFHASKIGSDFDDEAKFTVTTDLKSSKTFYLRLNTVQYFSKEDSLEYNIDSTDFKGRITINSRNRDFNPPKSLSIEIKQGKTDKPVLTQEFSAMGPDFETALATAKRVKHRVIQTDSLLLIDANTHLQRGELWRDQSVHLVLLIPENTTLHIESDLSRYLEDYSLWECQPNDANSDFLSTWIMTNNGLKCVNDSLLNKDKDITDTIGSD